MGYKAAIALMFGTVIMATSQAQAQYNSGNHYVNPYTRQDGTNVQGHYRTNPDNNPYNNYGSQQQHNPYQNRPTDYDSMGNKKSNRNPYGLY